MKKTDWFPADVGPVHKGWYERDWNGICTGNEVFDYWDGVDWFYGDGSLPLRAVEYSAPNNKKWRGLAEKPE